MQAIRKFRIEPEGYMLEDFLLLGINRENLPLRAVFVYGIKNAVHHLRFSKKRARAIEIVPLIYKECKVAIALCPNLRRLYSNLWM